MTGLIARLKINLIYSFRNTFRSQIKENGKHFFSTISTYID